MAYDLSSFKKSSENTLEWLKKEYASIRTNRATPSILDTVRAEAYGQAMPINQLATVSIEGPKSLRITPWDKGVAKGIDEAIRQANLGVSVSVDGEGIRVSFPDLTSDRRTLLVKASKEKLEEARITMRNEREKVLGDLDKSQKDGSISEDDKFRLKNDLQKLVDESNRNFEDLAKKKEKEIFE